MTHTQNIFEKKIRWKPSIMLFPTFWGKFLIHWLAHYHQVRSHRRLPLKKQMVLRQWRDFERTGDEEKLAYPLQYTFLWEIPTHFKAFLALLKIYPSLSWLLLLKKYCLLCTTFTPLPFPSLGSDIAWWDPWFSRRLFLPWWAPTGQFPVCQGPKHSVS